MIVVRLSDGSTIYGFGRFSVIARNAAGARDPFWERAAQTTVAEQRGDVAAALLSLPGATLIHHDALMRGRSATSVPAGDPLLPGAKRLAGKRP